jgi:hypothetical protein
MLAYRPQIRVTAYHIRASEGLTQRGDPISPTTMTSLPTNQVTERENLNSTAEANADSRKPYQAPSLVQYGDLRAITHMVGRNGNPDGGKGNMKGTIA